MADEPVACELVTSASKCTGNSDFWANMLLGFCIMYFSLGCLLAAQLGTRLVRNRRRQTQVLPQAQGTAYQIAPLTICGNNCVFKDADLSILYLCLFCIFRCINTLTMSLEAFGAMTPLTSTLPGILLNTFILHVPYFFFYIAFARLVSFWIGLYATVHIVNEKVQFAVKWGPWIGSASFLPFAMACTIVYNVTDYRPLQV